VQLLLLCWQRERLLHGVLLLLLRWLHCCCCSQAFLLLAVLTTPAKSALAALPGL
jgi:hypothetical protein